MRSNDNFFFLRFPLASVPSPHCDPFKLRLHLSLFSILGRNLQFSPSFLKSCSSTIASPPPPFSPPPIVHPQEVFSFPAIVSHLYSPPRGVAFFSARPSFSSPPFTMSVSPPSDSTLGSYFVRIVVRLFGLAPWHHNFPHAPLPSLLTESRIVFFSLLV